MSHTCSAPGWNGAAVSAPIFCYSMYEIVRVYFTMIEFLRPQKTKIYAIKTEDKYVCENYSL